MGKIPEKVLEEVKLAAAEGRLTCTSAHAIAERLSIEVLLIKQAADHLNIKIKDCQLGCF